jgi:hypothetical protein
LSLSAAGNSETVLDHILEFHHMYLITDCHSIINPKSNNHPSTILPPSVKYHLVIVATFPAKFSSIN